MNLSWEEGADCRHKFEGMTSIICVKRRERESKSF